ELPAENVFVEWLNRFRVVRVNFKVSYAIHMWISLIVLIFIVTPPPDRVVLVPPFRRAVKQLIHSPQTVESARVLGISVVNDSVLEGERAHARSLAHVRRRIGSTHGRERGSPFAGAFPWPLALVVVFEASLALLFFGESDTEVEVEIAAERRRPRKRPAQPLLVSLQLCQRCA